MSGGDGGEDRVNDGERSLFANFCIVIKIMNIYIKPCTSYNKLAGLCIGKEK